jgi:hypothetical protein
MRARLRLGMDAADPLVFKIGQGVKITAISEYTIPEVVGGWRIGGVEGSGW